MPEFKSTARLTPELFDEFQLAAVRNADRIVPRKFLRILTIALAVMSALLLLIGEYATGALGLAVVALYILYHRYALPAFNRAIVRAQLRLNEKKYGTPSPACETWLEENEAVTRIVETGETERFLLSKVKVHPTKGYIFLRYGFAHMAAFAKSDFTEAELTSLLAALADRGAKVLPNP